MQLNQSMPCGLDDSRLWDQADEIDEEDDNLTLMEKRIEWIFSDWQDAILDNTYDSWRDLRMMAYAAKQAITNSTGKTNWDDYKAFDTLGDIAFENGLECIQSDRYEGGKP